MDRTVPLVRDALLIETKALPNGAAAVNTDAFDLRLATRGAAGAAVTLRGVFLAECDLLISGPALTTTELPDTKTMKYDVECDSDVNFASAKSLAKEVLVQTGAGAAGAAAATARFRLPTDVERYVRVVATNDGAGDCTGKEVTAELLF